MSNDTSNSSRDELMLLGQVTVGDLSYFKAQQWSISNYVFLLSRRWWASAVLTRFGV